MNNTQRRSRSSAGITHIQENTQDHIPGWLRTAYEQQQIKFVIIPVGDRDKFNRAVAVDVTFDIDDDVIDWIILELYIAPPEKNYELIESTAVIKFQQAIWRQKPEIKHLTDHIQSVLQHILQFPVGKLYHQSNAFDSIHERRADWQLTSIALTAGLRSQLDHALGPLYGMVFT